MRKCINRLINEWMNGWMNRLINECMNGWMNRRKYVLI